MKRHCGSSTGRASETHSEIKPRSLCSTPVVSSFLSLIVLLQHIENLCSRLCVFLLMRDKIHHRTAELNTPQAFIFTPHLRPSYGLRLPFDTHTTPHPPSRTREPNDQYHASTPWFLYYFIPTPTCVSASWRAQPSQADRLTMIIRRRHP